VVRIELHNRRDPQRELDASLRRALGLRYDVVPEERVEAVRIESPQLFRSPTGDGALRLGVALGARWLAWSRVDFDGGSYALEIGLVDGRTGVARETRRDRCELCGWAEAKAKFAALAGSFVETPATPDEPNPQGATAAGPAGQGKRAQAATPGNVGGAGAGPGQGASGGDEAHPGDGARTHAVRPLAIVGWSALAVGAGLAVTGVVMLAWDGREVSCDAPGGLRCPRTYDFALQGGIVLGAGLATAAASTVLLVLDRRQAQREAIIPSVAPAPGGASIGVAGRF
jgi:hypothetical protein